MLKSEIIQPCERRVERRKFTAIVCGVLVFLAALVVNRELVLQRIDPAGLSRFEDVSITGAFRLSGFATPTLFTGARVDNYNPTNLATSFIIAQTASADTVLTGIAAQPTGTIINFYNISTFRITISNLDANSTATNQFTMPGLASWILKPGDSVLLRYTGSQWRGFSAMTDDFPTLTVDGDISWGGKTIGGGQITITGVNGTLNDYNPTGFTNATILDLTTSGATSISGFVGGTQSRRIVVQNNPSSTNTIQLFQASGSSAANQLQMPASTTWNLPIGASAVFEYNGSLSKWVMDSVATTRLPTLSVDGNSSLGGQTTVGGLIGTVQTFSTTGTINDFTLTSTTTTLLWTGTSQATLNGITGGANGRKLRIILATGVNNVSLVLANEAAASTAANRIIALGNTTLVLAPNATSATATNSGADLEYINDGTNSRWRVVSVLSSTISPPTTFNQTTTFAGTIVAAKVSAGGGHFHAGGTAIVPTSCGTSPSCNQNCTDFAGRVVTGATNTGCTIPFTNTYTTIPSCVCSTENPDATFKCVPSATNLVITYAANSNNVFDYHCLGGT